MKKSPLEIVQDGRRDDGYYHNPDFAGEAMAGSMGQHDAVQHSLGSWNSFDDVLPGQSGRDQFSRENYEHFRPHEAIPKKYDKIIEKIDKVYGSLSIVRNVIDLMSDFASEGIEIVHPVPAVERFYKDWFKKVNGIDRSERFLSGLYRHGMVVTRQFNADVKYKELEDKVAIGENIKVLEDRKIKPSNIPIKYLFYNPATFHHTNYHEINQKPKYQVKVPKALSSNQSFVGFNSFNTELVELPADRVHVSYYKKDDWTPKPLPLLYPVIKHAIMLEKLALADSAALDGAISKVRIFKVGHIEKDNMIWPKAGSMELLNRLLKSNTGGGTLDIIWDPAIDLIESDTDIQKFLGQEKYAPHLSQVYEGLGIPSSFVGVGQGTTNNYISLKILMRRLRSGRERLIEFWEDQLKQVQLAMGFAQPAQLEFNSIELGDEESERQLLIQLLDRNVISEERIQKILGYDPRMEGKRIKREEKARNAGRKPGKASQFHNAEKYFTLQKVALDKGFYAPEHLGITKKEGTEDIESPQDMRMNILKDRPGPKAEVKNDLKGGAGGRPKGAKDSVQRKEKTFSPVTRAKLEIWVDKTQEKINNILKKYILNALGHSSMREISSEEAKTLELLKFGVLSTMAPMQEVTEAHIQTVLDAPMSNDLISKYNLIKKELYQDKKIGASEAKTLQKLVYIENCDL